MTTKMSEGEKSPSFIRAKKAAYMRQYRQAHLEQIRANERKKYYKKPKEEHTARRREYAKKRYLENKEKLLAQNALYQKNPKRKEYLKQYRKNTIGKHRFRYSMRRALKRNATPKWCDKEKLKQIYIDCPEGYHVDHIIPLKGRTVCGLHIPDNLQYLPKFDNLSKGNKYDG